jgi:hypothetical protein
MKRRWVLAGVVGGALLCTAWWRSGRAPTAPAAVVTPAAIPTAAARPSGPTAQPLSVAPAAVSTASSAPVDADAKPRLTSLVHAQQYAEAVCRCADMPCANKLREEYNQSAGEATPVRDNQGMHDAFAKASKCARALDRPGG